MTRGGSATVNVGTRRLISEAEVERIIQRGVGSPRLVKTQRQRGG